MPYLAETEIAELAEAHGLADAVLRAHWARVLWLSTKGHPQLAHARIVSLERDRHWPMPSSGLSLTFDARV